MGVVAQETYEMVTFAKGLSGEVQPVIIALGKDLPPLAAELSVKSGCDVVGLTGDHLEHYNAQAYCSAIFEILQNEAPIWICLAHTSTGYDLAPLLAARLEAACITSVEKVSDGILSRSICSGRFIADIAPQTPSVVVTVLPGIYPPHISMQQYPAPIRIIETASARQTSTTLARKESQHRDSTLKDAEVIISAGRGIGKKDNVSHIKDLAAMFARSAIGASRPACDMGWLDYSCQIGVTGKTVSPRLYIACGISGAAQHISGMRGAQNIVAINTDPDAAIFHVAHYCIVEDLTTFIPLVISEYKSDRG